MTNKEIQAQIEVFKQEINKLEELVQEPKKTKTMWFWIVKTKSGVFFTNQMYTEEKIRKLWPKALEFKRVDMLGSEEVEV